MAALTWISPAGNTRNVEVKDVAGVVVAGLYQMGSIQNRMLYDWLRDIILIVQPAEGFDLVLMGTGGVEDLVADDDAVLLCGHYQIRSRNRRTLVYTINPEIIHARLPSRSHTGDSAGGTKYRQRTRERDNKCLVTGTPVFDEIYDGHQCAHIFPRSMQAIWDRAGYGDRITDPAPLPDVGGPSRIDSVQNVILLRSDMHGLWDHYRFGVNPKDNHRVVVFSAAAQQAYGKILDVTHIQDPSLKPLDELFEDHLRQCVLSNIRGEGEKPNGGWDAEEGFGEGVSLGDEIWTGEVGKKAFETHLFGRLGRMVDN